MKTKICSRCSKTFPLTPDYFQGRVVKGKWYSGWCKDCHREYARERQRKRRADPIERQKVLEEKRRYNQSKKGREWKRIRSVIDNHKRRQRKIAGWYCWTPAAWERCQQEWNYRCAYCGAEGTLLQDHFIPLSHPDCPGTVPGNMVPACSKCNLAKGSLHPAEWIQDKQVYARIVEQLAFP